MRRLAGFLLAAAGLAQWQPVMPRAGYMVDREGRLRELWGVSGNFVAGEPLLEGVISGASGRGGTAVKLERELLLLDAAGNVTARLDAPRGAALIAFDDAGRPALAWFPEARLLCRIRGKALEPVRSLGEELVTMTWLDEERSLAVVRRDGHLELVELAHAEHGPGSLLEVLPWDGPALILGRHELLVAEGERLHLRRGGGTVETLALPAAVTALHRVGEDWLGIVTADASRFALRVRGDRSELCALPEAAP